MAWVKAVGATLFLAACGGAAELPRSDLESVENVLARYRQAWIDNDAAGVMGYVSDDITLFVPGARQANVVGKERLRAFWFPPSDTVYRITTYEITDQELRGSGLYAIAQGKSLLTWDTVVRDSVHNTSSSRSEFLTVLRKEPDGWKLYRQMFITRG